MYNFFSYCRTPTEEIKVVIHEVLLFNKTTKVFVKLLQTQPKTHKKFMVNHFDALFISVWGF